MWTVRERRARGTSRRSGSLIGTLTVVLGLALVWLEVTPNPVAAQQSQAELPPTVELPADLDRVLRDYEEGWRNRDAAALAELFAPDGYVLRPGYPPAKGRSAIREAYATSGGPLFLRAFDYAVEGSVGFILGGYSGREGSPDSGKFVLTLRRDADGRWLIVADMDNGN